MDIHSDMDRRSFVRNGCNACVAIGTGLFLGSLESCSAPVNTFKTSQTNNKVSVPLTELANTDFKLVRLKNFGYDIGLQKQADGSYLALALICTHASNPLTKTGNGYACSLHGSRFDNEGNVKKGPAERSLVKLQSQQLGDQLEIQLQEIKAG